MVKLKVGVVGVGSMGKNHVRAYASLKHVCELIGVYDVNNTLAEDRWWGSSPRESCSRAIPTPK